MITGSIQARTTAKTSLESLGILPLQSVIPHLPKHVANVLLDRVPLAQQAILGTVENSAPRPARRSPRQTALLL